MSLHVIGCTHREASLDFRQKLAFSAAQAEDFLKQYQEKYPGCEVVLVSTCNRVEVYTATESADAPSFESELAFLSAHRGLSVESVTQNCFQLSGPKAAKHLFNVAASLDSMVLGEVQILSQIRHAYQQSVLQHSVGPILNSAFQTAVKIARRVAVETEIHRHRLSIASVAVKDFAGNIFETFSDKKALVIGAGEMAEETLTYLKDEGVVNPTVINRSPEKAQKLAESYQGTAVGWERLLDELRSADLVVTATGSSDFIVTADQFRLIHRARASKPVFIVDLAVPRDFDPNIGKFPEVYLYSIDDLEQTCERNRKAREKQLPRAMSIVQEETEKFIQQIRHRKNAPILTKLREEWDSIKESELERLFNKRPNLSDEDRQAIVQTFDRTMNKILNNPYQTLRDASQEEVPRGLLDSMAKLFRLK